MKELTLVRCLDLLNIQREYIEREGKTQYAYYQGLKDMLEIVISENYANHKQIAFNEFTGKHYICEF